MTCSLPTDPDKRAEYPMAEGLLDYFPNALAEVSRLSKIANDQHNPGQRMHWSRGKSTDHANKIVKHLIDRGKLDADGIRHSAKVAWRALAMLQEELEHDDGYPMPRNAWVDPQPPDYDPDSVAFPRSKDALRELAREALGWGMYAYADTPEKSPLAPTRIATPEELSALAKLKASAALDIPTLRNAGIGDVKCNPRASHDAKIAIDMAWDAWRARTDFGTPAETAYLASFAPNPHPMMAETLRDEYEKTNEGTGL
jgi:hypothetical protein